MTPQEIIIPEQDWRKLLAAASGDAALLYLFLRAGGSPEQAEASLRLSKPRMECAEAALKQMGLWPETPKILRPAQPPVYTEADLIQAQHTEFPRLLGEAQRRLGKVSDFVQNAAKAGFHTLVLTTPQVYDQVGSAVGTKVYESDYKTLISLNRSNGGVTCFSDGYLIRKWSVTKLPSAEDLDAIRSEDEAEIVASRSTEGNLIFQGFLLYVFAVMLLL